MRRRGVGSFWMSETEPFFLTYDAGLPVLPTLRVLVLDELEEDTE